MTVYYAPQCSRQKNEKSPVKLLPDRAFSVGIHARRHRSISLTEETIFESYNLCNSLIVLFSDFDQFTLAGTFRGSQKDFCRGVQGLG